MTHLLVRRPLAGLKTTLRHLRLARQQYSTTTEQTTAPVPTTPVATLAKKPTSPFRLFRPKTNKSIPYALYPPLPAPPKNPLPPWTSRTLAQLDPTGARSALLSKTRPDRAKVGDVLLVSTAKGEPFAGALMQIRRRGIDTAIQLRGQLLKTSVELWFKVYSPAVTGIDVVWRRPRRARRARLTYLRKPKHDMGSVDDLVFAWRKERARLRTSKRGGNVGTTFEPKK